MSDKNTFKENLIKHLEDYDTRINPDAGTEVYSKSPYNCMDFVPVIEAFEQLIDWIKSGEFDDSERAEKLRFSD